LAARVEVAAEYRRHETVVLGEQVTALAGALLSSMTDISPARKKRLLSNTVAPPLIPVAVKPS
jgi:hypothetical protein